MMKNKLIDLIDFEKVNVLLEGFNKATGFVTAILDFEGNVLQNMVRDKYIRSFIWEFSSKWNMDSKFK